MPEYKCECCVFITMDKQKYSTHLLTNKHRKLFDNKEKSIYNIMNDEIQKLREEVAYLKGKLEVYEKVFHKGRQEVEVEVEEVPQKYEGEKTDAIILFDAFRQTIDLQLDEPTIERIAELRTIDDEAGEVNADNFIEAFTSNEINFLSHMKTLNDLVHDENAINDLIVNEVLKKCKIEVTEKYKGRFKLFHNGEWHKPQESEDLLNEFMTDVRVYFRNCIKSLKYYYAFNSVEKELGDYDIIKPKIQRILNKMNNEDEEDRLKYIINKVSSYQ